MPQISLEVNGSQVTGEAPPNMLLADFLRKQLALTGTHIGCDTSQCGACVVLLDGDSIKSCTVLAVQTQGRKVTTVEGLSSGPELHPVQAAFREAHALQCGFCTPGMIMSTDRSPRQDPQSERRRDPYLAQRQYLPLHRLP